MKMVRRPAFNRRLQKKTVCAAMVYLGGLMLLTPGALAVLSVNNTLQSDGTAGFDPQSGAGFDTGPNNQIVRTNDTLTYNVSLTTRGIESGIVVTAVLPQVGGKTVTTWPALPGYCITGSSISADGRTITCALGPIGKAGSDTATNVFLDALVMGTTANGVKIPAPTITVSTSTGPAPASPSTPATVTVSAAPFYDIVIQGSYQGSPQFYGYSGGSGPANQDGFFSRPLIGIVAKNPNGFGSKGVEQLDPTKPISINMDLSGMPTGTIVDNYHTGTAPYGTPAATTDFRDGCGSPGWWSSTDWTTNPEAPSSESGSHINMYDRVGDLGPTSSTLSNVVPNGGTCTVTGSTATTVSLNITGTDTTLARHPDTLSGTGSPVPPTEWWVANKALVLWTPTTSYSTTKDVDNTIRLGTLAGTSITGQSMKNVSTTNDSVSYAIRLYNDGFAQKHYTENWYASPAPYATKCDPAVTSDCDVNFMSPN